MMNIYAIVDADGQVERLSTGLDGVPIPDGHIAVTLVDTVTSWPTPPSDAHTLMCSLEGLLFWADNRSPQEALSDQLRAIRSTRNALLLQSDINALRELESFGQISPAVRQYRQSLRDMTTSQADLANPIWPTM